MNKQSKIAFVVALALMALTALGLSRLQSFQRLGTPGVKLIERVVYREDGVVVGSNSVALPDKVLNFESKEHPISKVVTDWLPKDTVYAQRSYHAPDGFWTLANVVLMGTDRTSIHDPKYCLAGQGFQTEKVERDAIQIQEPHPYSLPLLKMTVRREVTAPDGTKVPQSALYVFWFVADQQITAEHKERMWWMARDLITRGILQRWAYVSCFSACAPGQEEETYARLREWIAAAVPRFQIATGPARVSLASNP
jgi:hypothetical protein